MSLEHTYHLCSSTVIQHFPDIAKSNSFKSGYDFDKDTDYFVIMLSDNEENEITKYYENVISPYNDKSNCPIDFWTRPCCNSFVEVNLLSLDACKRKGLFLAIEIQTGLTKEQNRAYAIYSLANKYGITPIELINKISKPIKQKKMSSKAVNMDKVVNEFEKASLDEQVVAFKELKDMLNVRLTKHQQKLQDEATKVQETMDNL